MTTLEPSAWLGMAELVELLGISPGRVHRLIEERRLVATRVDGALRVPAAFLRDGEPLPELRGTVLVLGDAGFDDDEIVRWLTSPEGSLGDVPPIEALLAGRKAEVRRVAQALGF